MPLTIGIGPATLYIVWRDAADKQGERTMKHPIKNLDHLWTLIDSGVTVYWCNESYAITVEYSMISWRTDNGFPVPWSNKNGFCLRVTCTSNYFGSLLDEKDLPRLFYNQSEV